MDNKSEDIDEDEDKDNNNLNCQYCLKKYSSKSTLTRHLKDNCKIKKQKDIEKENKLKVLLEKDKLKENEINELKKQNQLILIQNKKLNDKFNKLNKNDSNNNQINQIHNTIKKLETSIPANTNLTISSQLVEQLIQKDKQLEEFITQKNNNLKSKSNIPDDNFDDLLETNTIIENEQIEDTKPMTLILNNDIIEYRKSDGYINATQLCKAGGKKFNDWYRLDSTKQLILEFIKSNKVCDAGNPVSQTNILFDNKINNNSKNDINDLISEYIDIKKGNSNNFEQGTWINPDLAIQLAQWISPSFALQVSHWIRTLFTKGKVEVNLKIIKEKENEIKEHKKRIKILENMILKKQTRNKYDESVNVVYIITNEDAKLKRTYTIGKAKNFVDRLSTYDKLQTHEVIYSKSFENENMMKIAEDIVLAKLNKYKEIECRDRFILPIGADIKIFIKPITDAYNLLSE